MFIYRIQDNAFGNTNCDFTIIFISFVKAGMEDGLHNAVKSVFNSQCFNYQKNCIQYKILTKRLVSNVNLWHMDAKHQRPLHKPPWLQDIQM